MEIKNTCHKDVSHIVLGNTLPNFSHKTLVKHAAKMRSASLNAVRWKYLSFEYATVDRPV